MKKLIFALSVSSFTMAVLMAQEKVDEATSARMRSEELEHSKIMHTLHMLTDRYGPRVTGTPNHEAAAKWAVAEMTSWGMKNGHLEPWDFGRAGWLNESATGQIAAPVRENLKFEVLAWTPSTKGTVNASAGSPGFKETSVSVVSKILVPLSVMSWWNGIFTPRPVSRQSDNVSS